MAGLVPVPIYPPFRRDRIEEYARRQATILANAQARVLVTFAEGLPVGHLLRSLVPSIGAVTTVPALKAAAPDLSHVLAANHASYLDVVLLLAALPADFRFVAKRELLSVPLVGRLIRKVGHLTVERGRAPQSVADAARVTEALRAGVSVLLFPEGTFVRSAGILPFRLGAFKAAMETGSPIIPIVLRGTREVLPAEVWLPRPGPLTVAVGTPLRSGEDGWPEMVRLRDETRKWIARRSGERLLERAPTAS